MKLLFATTNAGKVRELKALVEDLPIEVLSLADLPPQPEVEEDGRTFAENAEKKAREHFTRLGLATLADDSGLCVDALNGAPGIHSARFAGVEGPERDAANIARLLEELKDVPDEKRGAEFRCALSLVSEAGTVAVEGVCRGRILRAPAGAEGFGYDPVFYVPELGKTFAEVSREEKNLHSHRARAFQLLRTELERLAGQK